MGTYAWRNWQTSTRGPADNPARFEDALYSDAWFIGGRLELGPYSVLSTMAPRNVAMPMALVLRYEVHLPPLPELIEHKTNELLPTDDSNYHGGTLSEEVAALLSLALGVRCRAGGTTRVWGLRSEDPAGDPMEFNRQYLSRPGPPDTEILLGMDRDVHLQEAEQALMAFSHLAPKNATRLARAARLYSNALWWANEDPNFAWLQLVGAIEAVSSGWKPGKREPVEVLEEFLPRVWEALNDAPTQTRQTVAKELAQQVGATRKFVNFVEDFAPDPPDPRPEYAVDWRRLSDHMRIIYGHRSRALHDGTPFPGPMLDQPRNGPDGVPSEAPIGITAAARGGSWSAAEMPMSLHTFEYIVRGSLLNWLSHLGLSCRS